MNSSTNWKTTSILCKNGTQPQFLGKLEVNLFFFSWVTFFPERIILGFRSFVKGVLTKKKIRFGVIFFEMARKLTNKCFKQTKTPIGAIGKKPSFLERKKMKNAWK
jgi:hypothetical protein